MMTTCHSFGSCSAFRSLSSCERSKPGWLQGRLRTWSVASGTPLRPALAGYPALDIETVCIGHMITRIKYDIMIIIMLSLPYNLTCCTIHASIASQL